MPGVPTEKVAPAVPPRSQEFAAEAMATTFRVQVVADDAVYARQAAAAAFEELERLERLLSRYEESSDISRINRLSAGQRTVVAVETFACLNAAQQLKQKTGGAFDVAYASADGRDTASFRLDRASHTVEVLARRVQIDLGGIGKGYALDRMMRLLREWDISAAMLWASTSTVLAFGHPQLDRDWTVDFGSDGDLRRQTLRGTALSASGTAIKGNHIVNPRTGRPAPPRRTWVAAPTAAWADALSTAFMVMSLDEVRGCCRRDPRITAFVAGLDEQPLIRCNE